MSVAIILFIVAAVLAALAAFGVATRVNLGWAAVSVLSVALAITSGLG